MHFLYYFLKILYGRDQKLLKLWVLDFFMIENFQLGFHDDELLFSDKLACS